MHAQLIPTPLCAEAASALAELLAGRVPASLNDGYFTVDWAPLWGELARDEWTTIADRSDSQFSLLDLTAFAQVWGQYLVPLPFMATLAVRRHLTALPSPDTRLSYALAESDATLLPHGPAAALVLTADGLAEPSALAKATGLDDWAASVPVTLLPAEAARPAAVATREAAILAAAEAVGAAAEVLRRTVEYAKLRQQFGRPIGRFQAIKHRLANMHCRVELATSALAWACFDPTGTVRALRAALADCLLVAEEAVQVHGGIGYTWEAAPHRFYRHIMSTRRIVTAALDQAC